MTRRVWALTGAAVVVAAGLVAGVSSLRSAPYDPMVLPLQTVHEVRSDAVVIDGALCNTDDALVEARVTLHFAPESRGRPVAPIFVESVQDYLPGCEVHHHACANPGDNGACPISVCQGRVAGLPDIVTSCHPPFVNTFTPEMLAELETGLSPQWRVVGTVTPIAPSNGVTAPIQSEVFTP